jgi:hypothetical protein
MSSRARSAPAERAPQRWLIVRVSSPGSGFAWGDTGIDAAAAPGLLLIALAASRLRTGSMPAS